ncbi:zinc finger CCCH domain-containing protein 23 isoform X2 [Gossypium hirsutum]|uniref:Zinc finger CCCH domain-containing protein 23 isoform X2 n=1 Tax=Gossypium hirsutum TaxID=3635 RepID=A0ABM3BFI1_GOSHI|nr:zinc finger CCCH domain-containing protein 23-like isoform X2 [Gossypium hirsutum]XP_040965811.1 zinc finger CCCH domain-containing protein 23-like isoform X2 [Gossypium hirsutum]
MDGYEATRIVFSRIQSLEPGNASRIMGLLLIQDHGDKEMIRLAFGPEALLHSVILKAKKELGLPINSSSSRLLGSNGVNLPFLSIPATNPSFTFTGMVDEFQLQDQLADACGGNTDSIRFPSYWGNTSFQRSNNTMNDILGADDPSSAFLWRPCLYFARGFCKNGNNCRFIHSGVGESAAEGDTIVGSPNKFEMMDQCHELLRSKSARQQRLAAAAAAVGAAQIMGSGSFPYSPKSINLVLQQPQNDAQRAALMMGDDMNKFNRSSPASRQIYLTFPADSTFREEDVSNYFRKQPQQQIENGTLTGLDSRDPFDVQLGTRMFYNNQDILRRRKLGDQTDLQQALELQNRRLMSLQLLDVKKHSPNLYGQSLVLPQENSSSPVPATLVTAAEKQTSTGKETVSSEENGSEKESPHCEDGNLPESLA